MRRMGTLERVALLMGLMITAALSTARAEDLSERLAACAACHGVRGEGKAASEYYPHLAGKPAGYLLDQLQAFRDGRRVSPQMTWLMRNMGDAYLAAIAEHYAQLPPRSFASTRRIAPADAARARELVEHGDAARDVPACVACHGANLAGHAPGVPSLLGLPPDYVIAQLGAWRTGVRSARAPDCMARIAKALDPADMRRLGEWLSSKDAGDSVVPAPAGSFALPRACGNLPFQAPP
jgi:cytochrome c553